MNIKARTARLSVFSNSVLIIFNLIVGIISGSVSIISEAIHTVMDLLAAIMAFFSVKKADEPPDKHHPYGHGKYENISGVIEAILIFVASGWIIYEAVHRIMDPRGISDFGLHLGIIVMIFSAVINYFVSRRLFKVAKETDSIALKADALHLSTHVYTSTGIAIGLLLMRITGIAIIDPLIAILVALYILKEAYDILKAAFAPLLDVRLPDAEVEIIHASIQKHLGECMQAKDIRTRKSGSYRHVDFILIVPGDLSVKESHVLCDTIEHGIMDKLPYTMVSIHVEPCEPGL